MITHGMSKDYVERVGTKGATRENLAKILDDVYLYTDREEQSVGQWLSNTGYWESWITSWMTNNIKPGFVCLDIGANYGYYTRIMERLAESSGKVYAFEANKNLSNMISKSIVDYPIDNGAPVTVFSVAVSDSKGTVTLNIPPNYIGGSSIVWGQQELPSTIPQEEWTIAQEVESDTVDHLLGLDHIDIIKIDIEGAEPLAWKGMEKTLSKTDLLIIEFGPYMPSEFIDQLYNDYEVSHVTVTGEEVPLSRLDFEKLEDLTMGVLRRRK
jgi:FkbM family methyltransferase